MPDLFNFSEKVNLEGYSFLLPSVSVGNVPQLTIDLFITTFKLKKISTVWHPAIIPCVGPDPYYDGEDICTACELFINKEMKLIAMQLRSGLEPKFGMSFFHELKNELGNFKLKQIIILTSIFDYELHNINSNKFFYICDNNSHEECSNMQKLHKDINGRYILNGGGFGLKLYEFLNNIRCVIVGKYVSEGDNRPDACSLLIKLLPLVGIQNNISEIIYPSSWKYVFGGPAPSGIF